MHLVAHGSGGALLGKLFDDHTGGDHVFAQTAILFGYAESPKTFFSQSVQGIGWKSSQAVCLIRSVGQFPGGDVSGAFLPV